MDGLLTPYPLCPWTQILPWHGPNAGLLVNCGVGILAGTGLATWTLGRVQVWVHRAPAWPVFLLWLVVVLSGVLLCLQAWPVWVYTLAILLLQTVAFIYWRSLHRWYEWPMDQPLAPPPTVYLWNIPHAFSPSVETASLLFRWTRAAAAHLQRRVRRFMTMASVRTAGEVLLWYAWTILYGVWLHGYTLRVAGEAYSEAQSEVLVWSAITYVVINAQLWHRVMHCVPFPCSAQYERPLVTVGIIVLPVACALLELKGQWKCTFWYALVYWTWYAYLVVRLPWTPLYMVNVHRDKKTRIVAHQLTYHRTDVLGRPHVPLNDVFPTVYTPGPTLPRPASIVNTVLLCDAFRQFLQERHIGHLIELAVRHRRLLDLYSLFKTIGYVGSYVDLPPIVHRILYWLRQCVTLARIDWQKGGPLGMWTMYEPIERLLKTAPHIVQRYQGVWTPSSESPLRATGPLILWMASIHGHISQAQCQLNQMIEGKIWREFKHSMYFHDTYQHIVPGQTEDVASTTHPRRRRTSCG